MGLIGRLRRYLIAGVLVIAPTVITAYVFYRFFKAVDGVLGKYITPFGSPIPGLGFVAVVLITILVGVFARNILGRSLLSVWEAILTRIPLVNKLYLATKQIGEAILDDKGAMFKRVVLLQYPRKGIYSLAFVTHTPGGELEEKVGAGSVAVFLPTTPNPTSGFFLVVPEKETVPLSLSVEDAIKLIVSFGIAGPKAVARTELPALETVEEKAES